MKLLFCGGSHLSNLKKYLSSELLGFESSFLVTGGAYQFWSRDGHRFKTNGTKVSNLFNKPEDFEVDLANYNRIIFVGQLLQPHRCFYGDRPLSKALVREILNPEHFPAWMKSFPSNNINSSTFYESNPWFYNEPLALFPKLSTGKCISLDDPLPRHPAFASVPNHAKRSFLEEVDNFCKRNQILRIPQHQSTISNFYTTLDAYACEDPNDFTHANELYWQITWKELLKALKTHQ